MILGSFWSFLVDFWVIFEGLTILGSKKRFLSGRGYKRARVLDLGYVTVGYPWLDC